MKKTQTTRQKKNKSKKEWRKINMMRTACGCVSNCERQQQQHTFHTSRSSIPFCLHVWLTNIAVAALNLHSFFTCHCERAEGMKEKMKILIIPNIFFIYAGWFNSSSGSQFNSRVCVCAWKWHSYNTLDLKKW